MATDVLRAARGGVRVLVERAPTAALIFGGAWLLWTSIGGVALLGFGLLLTGWLASVGLVQQPQFTALTEAIITDGENDFRHFEGVTAELEHELSSLREEMEELRERLRQVEDAPGD